MLFAVDIPPDDLWSHAPAAAAFMVTCKLFLWYIWQSEKRHEAREQALQSRLDAAHQSHEAFRDEHDDYLKDESKRALRWLASYQKHVAETRLSSKSDDTPKSH